MRQVGRYDPDGLQREKAVCCWVTPRLLSGRALESRHRVGLMDPCTRRADGGDGVASFALDGCFDFYEPFDDMAGDAPQFDAFGSPGSSEESEQDSEGAPPVVTAETAGALAQHSDLRRVFFAGRLGDGATA